MGREPALRSAGTATELAVAPARKSAAVDELREWQERAGTNPERALRRARDLLRTGQDEHREREALAHHVAGLAHVEKGRLTEAHEHTARGVDAAAGVLGLGNLEGRLRLTQAWIELERGDADACWTQLSGIQPEVDGGRADCLRGLLHYHAGRYGAALLHLDAALDRLRQPGWRAGPERRWVANALIARGMARMYSGVLVGAEEDFIAAEAHYRAEDLPHRAAACLHNLGCVAFRAGDIPGALRWFDRAESSGLERSGNPEALADRGAALSEAGLVADAVRTLQEAVDRLAECGRTSQLAETLLALARSLLASDDPSSAGTRADQARQLFRAQGRPAWAAIASAVELRARLTSGRATRHDVAVCRSTAADCAAYGWAAVAVELLISAARAALTHGRAGQARSVLQQACVVRAQGVVGAPQHAAGFLAEAMLAEMDGDRDGLFHACGEGLRVLDEHAAACASIELQCGSGTTAVELADVAIGQTLAERDPVETLVWSERRRAGSLARRPLSPPDDPLLAEDLLALRTATLRLRESHDAPDEEMRRQVAAWEKRVRHRAMVADAGAGLRVDFRLPEVRSRLNGTALLSLTVHNGRLHAVAIVDDDIRLHDLGSQSEVTAQAEALRFALGQRAAGVWTSPFVDAIPRLCEKLEHTLLSPVLDGLDSQRPLLVVPTGPLHALPWAALPCCRNRSVTIIPSLSCWLRADQDARRRADGAVWISGPGLEHAENEVRDLHSVAGGTALTGSSATASAVLSAVDGASMVHIATHGWFRPDQPLLSCVDMADGPLYAYDLVRLRHGPKTVVLSACEVGRCAVRPGDELRGVAATLLGRGTATLIASLLPVPDQRTAAVMASLHDWLRRGVPHAAALARAQAEHGEVGFICLGAGHRVGV